MKAAISAYAGSPFHFAKKGALAEVRPDTLAAQVRTQATIKKQDRT
jgi:acetyl-CoA acyltransferase